MDWLRPVSFLMVAGCVLEMLSGTGAWALDTAFRSPDRPSSLDCRDLNNRINGRLSALQREHSECLRQPTQFGQASHCVPNSAGSWRIASYGSAWKQCDFNAEQICELRNSGRREVEICRSRALREDRAARLDNQDIEKANTRYDRLASSLSDARSAITDPAKFFGAESIKPVVSSINPEWSSHNSMARDPHAKELFRYLQFTINGGTSATMSPLIRSIQRQQLDRLLNHFRQANEKLRSLQYQVENFTIQERSEIQSQRFQIDRQSEERAQRNTRGRGTDISRECDELDRLLAIC